MQAVDHDLQHPPPGLGGDVAPVKSITVAIIMLDHRHVERRDVGAQLAGLLGAADQLGHLRAQHLARARSANSFPAADPSSSSRMARFSAWNSEPRSMKPTSASQGSSSRSSASSASADDLAAASRRTAPRAAPPSPGSGGRRSRPRPRRGRRSRPSSPRARARRTPRRPPRGSAGGCARRRRAVAGRLLLCDATHTGIIAKRRNSLRLCATVAPKLRSDPPLTQGAAYVTGSQSQPLPAAGGSSPSSAWRS